MIISAAAATSSPIFIRYRFDIKHHVTMAIYENEKIEGKIRWDEDDPNRTCYANKLYFDYTLKI